MTTEIGRMPLQVGSVTLAVRDIGRTAAFYQDVIGLRPAAAGSGAVWLGAGGMPFLCLLHRPGALPDEPKAAGLFHIAFLLPSRADLGRWMAHARGLGVALDGSADHLVSEAVYLHDPEGNGVEIYADRPRAQWPWQEGTDGKRIVMANRPLDAAGLLGEAGVPWAGAPQGTRIGHVHLRVGDVAAARRFYGDMLGLATTAEWPGVAFMSSGGYHHHVGANIWRSPGAGLRDPHRAGLADVVLEAADGGIAAGIAERSGVADLAGAGLRDPWGTAVHITLASKEPTW